MFLASCGYLHGDGDWSIRMTAALLCLRLCLMYHRPTQRGRVATMSWRAETRRGRRKSLPIVRVSTSDKLCLSQRYTQASGTAKWHTNLWSSKVGTFYSDNIARCNRLYGANTEKGVSTRLHYACRIRLCWLYIPVNNQRDVSLSIRLTMFC